MELTASTAELAAAVSDISRLLPARTIEPVLTGVLIRATAQGLELAGTDRERTVRLAVPGPLVHTEGIVLVPGRPLADTLRALDVPEVRLVVEGARLAVRTPHSRFALPLLDVDLHPGVPAVPPLAGRVAGGPVLRALAAVAGAASRDEALPVFTGVRIRGSGDTLRLVATDRYRLAVAELRYSPAGEYDVLVPAALVTELVRQAAGVAELALHADHDRAAFGWHGADIGTALLATPFPDEERYLRTEPAATVEVAAEALAAAVRRVGRYADGRGAIELRLGDGEVRVCGGDTEFGEAEESVKAGVHGRVERTYRARYLLDALHAFGARAVRLDFQDGRKGTMLTEAEPDPDGVTLRYLVMPILAAAQGSPAGSSAG